MEEERTENRVRAGKPGRRRKKRRKKHYFIKFCIAVALTAGLIMFINSSVFDISGINVEGNNRFSEEEIITKSGIKKGENAVLLHASDSEKKLLSDPFISEAEVKRQLPDRVHITVSERKILTGIKKGKKYYLFDKDNILLKTHNDTGGNTEVSGVSFEKCSLGETAKIEPEKKYDDAKRLIKKAMKQKIRFKKIEILKDGIRAYISEGIYFKGTSGNIETALDRNQLKSVVSYVHRKGLKTGVITVEGKGYIAIKAK